jgi:hypothetical protein
MAECNLRTMPITTVWWALPSAGAWPAPRQRGVYREAAVSAEAITRELAESLGFILVILSFIGTVAGQRLLRLGRTLTDALGLFGCVAFLVANLLPPDWPFEATWLALAVSRIFIIFWRRRPKSRRGTRALWGQKGLVRLRSMLGTLRARAKPRPVLKPQRSPA